jgi:hypothetical protein
MVLFCLALTMAGFVGNTEEVMNKPILLKKISIPDQLLAKSQYGAFGGDIRIGDLTGDGRMDFLVYRGTGDMHDGGGYKPNFIGTFNMEGEILWVKGEPGRGKQPGRPGAVAIYDLDADGHTEVICLFVDAETSQKPQSFEDAEIMLLDGATGEIKKRAAPSELTGLSGKGRQWAHQRIIIANLRGNEKPQDFIIKLGHTVLAFDDDLNVLWTYKMPEYFDDPKNDIVASYIPAIGDLNGDGRDEVFGGYYLIDPDGNVLWEKVLGPHMDSVVIAEWDMHMRAIGSGGGFVMDEQGDVILELGEDVIPHGQELRVGRFDESVPGQQMMIRYNGHTPEVMLVGQTGEVIRRFRINPSPNNTDMEAIYWHGLHAPALLYNGGSLWQGNGMMFSRLPELPTEKGDKKMGWYHCIPVDAFESPGEELVVYNPWDRYIFLYSKPGQDGSASKKFTAGPRQYNVRLMD